MRRHPFGNGYECSLTNRDEETQDKLPPEDCGDVGVGVV